MGQGEIYRESSEILERLCGVELSDKQIEHLCHHYGQILEENPVQEVPSTSKDDALHYVMVDGSYIMSREDSWKETKLGRIFKADDNYALSENRKIIRKSTYVAHVGDCHEFMEKISPTMAQLSNFVAIADGATWFWNYLDDHYPQTVQILDFYHAFEKICQWAVMIYKDKAERDGFIDKVKDLLLNDQVNEVIIQIQNVTCRGDSLAKKEVVLTYLNNNKHRMLYKTFSQKGYLIGSGAMESAHRNVIQCRMKRSGQRWTLVGAQQLLNIRTKRLSNQWDEVQNIIRLAA